MDLVLVSFSFLAGLQAFFAPCSIALIPAYVGYYVKEDSGEISKIQQLLFGLKAGSFTSLRLISVYVTFFIFTAQGVEKPPTYGFLDKQQLTDYICKVSEQC